MVISNSSIKKKNLIDNLECCDSFYSNKILIILTNKNENILKVF